MLDMRKVSGSLVLSLVMAVMLLGGCKKKIEPKVEVADEISRFVWNGLNEYYLWYQEADNLTIDDFANTDAWYSFLNNYGTDYEGLFYDLLYDYPIKDRFSWIVDDYVALENSFAGISKTMGHDFRLVRFSDSDNIFGYVRYVVNGSPADIAGIKRGDLFRKVDGQQLTMTNYYDLLFGQDEYTIEMAIYDEAGTTITSNGVTHDLVAVELQENPIHYSTIMDIGGVQTAYLVYNAFTSNYNFELNDLFADYVAAGVQRLILDLRYNGGGSIQTAIYLASMIHSNNPIKIFSKVEYNDKLQDYYISTYGADDLNYYFADKLTATTTHPEATLATLGLDDLYVITASGTASASELIINGLDPYMNVTVVGDTTTGKNVGSATIKDWNAQGVVNPNHLWAMQPIILKIANSQNFSDYFTGLIPEVALEEDIVNLLPFGNENELLLKAVIDDILGTTTKSMPAGVSRELNYIFVADSKDFVPHSKEMYLDKPVLIR